MQEERGLFKIDKPVVVGPERAVDQWPILYGLTSANKIKQWLVYAVRNDDDTASLWKEHGQVGGQIQRNERVIKTGKNLGKANATTAYEQACLEAESAYKKKIDKGYTESVDGESDVYLPMLAQRFAEAGHHIQYPAMCEKKFNGVRCFAKKMSEVEIDFSSRKGKSYNATLQHLTPHLLPIMQVGEIFDGEIYIHGFSFQQILRLVKKYRPGKTEQLQFWIYDIADPESTNEKRKAKLFNIFGNGAVLADAPLRHVNRVLVDSPDGVYECHRMFVKEGFEGVIIRNLQGLYKFNHRSQDLQKYKEFFDKEVTIIGGKEGEGLETGCVIFAVRDENGNEFSSRPRGSRKMRRKWYDEIDKLIGKELTIRYQELSEDGVPVFNVGIAIRDYE